MGSKGGQSSISNTMDFFNKNMAGSSSGVSSQTPDPLAALSYQQALLNASQIANTPYQPYMGQQTAGFTPDQLAAMQGLRDVQGMTQPYINQASALTNQAVGLANPNQFTSTNLQKYMNPYQQSVIDATLANMKQNQDEMFGKNTAESVRRGTYGGSGQALGRAEQMRQLGLSNAQTLAGLNAANYQQAMGQYNQQQAAAIEAMMKGAAQQAGLGNQALLARGTELSALGQSGAQQQALAQQQLDKAYQMWQQAKAYPYQQMSYFGNLAQGLGPLMGQYGTQAANQQGTESGFSSGQKRTQTSGGGGGIPGAITAGLGILSALKDGGVVSDRQHRADGGYMEHIGEKPYGEGPIDLKAGFGQMMNTTPFSDSPDNYITRAEKTSKVMKPAKEVGAEKLQSAIDKALGIIPKSSGKPSSSLDDGGDEGSESSTDYGKLAKQARGVYDKASKLFDFGGSSDTPAAADTTAADTTSTSSDGGFDFGSIGDAFSGMFNSGGRVHRDNGGVTDRDYISGLYQQAFGRDPDQAGLDYWTDQLSKGKTREDVANTFGASPEMENITNARKDWLSSLYNLDFNRGPDLGGFDYWLRQMREGMKPEEVVKKFGQSPESLGTIENLYQSKLGRSADPTGLDYWRRQMESGLGLTNMGRYFGQSPEAGKDLEAAYTKAFGRGPEQSAVKYAQGQLAGPLSLEEAKASFYNTPEYKASHPTTTPEKGSYGDLLYKAYQNDPGPQLSPENQGIASMPTSYYYNKYSGLTGATPQIQGYYSNIASTTVNPYTGLFNLAYTEPYFGSSPSYNLNAGSDQSDKLRGIVNEKLTTQLPKTSADGGRINRARGGTLSKEDVARAALQAGATPSEAAILTAIAMPESARNPYAHNTKRRDNSYGLWQINMLGAMGPERMRQFGLSSYNDLFDPVTNAKAALQLLRSKRGPNHWSTYLSGAYKPYYSMAANVVNSLVQDPNAVKAPIDMPARPTMVASDQPHRKGLIPRLIEAFSPISTAHAGESVTSRINPADPSGPLLPEGTRTPLPRGAAENYIRGHERPRTKEELGLITQPQGYDTFKRSPEWFSSAMGASKDRQMLPETPERISSADFPMSASPMGTEISEQPVVAESAEAETRAAPEAKRPTQKYWGDYRDVEASGLGDLIDMLAGDVKTAEKPGTRSTPMGKYQGQGGLGALFDLEGTNPYEEPKSSKKKEEGSDFGSIFDIFG